MDFMIYSTERCNLNCDYCETAETRNKFEPNPAYNIEQLNAFLKDVPDLNLHFYGGEPLLNIIFIKDVLKIPHKRATMQTNGLLLDKLDTGTLNKFEVISVSIDGPEEVTDKHRGKGIYRKVIEKTKNLKQKGFSGLLNVRMTISPGVDIESSVMHFINGCETKFDNIHWQLNVLFHEKDWKQNKEEIKRWFKESYNPKITKLIKFWLKEMVNNNQVIQIIPFIGIMHSLLTGAEVKNVRCGAGWAMWVITTSGDIYPCPVMRNYPEFKRGNINSISYSEIKPACTLENCNKCEAFNLCGGRCLCVNKKNEWDSEGYDLVCDSVKHLIKTLRKARPIVNELISKGKISLEDFRANQDYEVIP